MSTNVTVDELKINKLTKAQYDTAVQTGVIGDNEISIITDLLDTQVTSMPTAEAKYEGIVVQFTGTTDANYTNSYFYKCVSDGTTPTPNYSWTRVDVQPAGSSLPSQTGQSGKFLTTNGTDASWDNIPTELPSQSGNNGKFLTTDGSTVSWATVPGSLPSQTGNAGKVLGTDGTDASWTSTVTTPFYLENYSKKVTLGIGSTWEDFNLDVRGSNNTNFAGSMSFSRTENCIMFNIAGSTARNFYFKNGTNRISFYSSSTFDLGSSTYKAAYTYTAKLNNGSDIDIPNIAGTMAIQVSSLPTAASGYVGQIYQFIGTTDSNYTNGYFYKCIDNSGTYSWTQLDVQPSGGGGSLPSQTGNAGKFLTTDGTDASWGEIAPYTALEIDTIWASVTPASA